MYIRPRSMKTSTFAVLVLGMLLAAASLVIVELIGNHFRAFGLAEAKQKARLLASRNLATHQYFSEQLKPSLFETLEPIMDEDYFDPHWMSSTFAVRHITGYLRELDPESGRLYYKEAAIDARSPQNEADAREADFLRRLNSDPGLTFESGTRDIDGEPFFEVLRRGERLDEPCLRCHSTPERAPGGLVERYGPERSFGRKTGETISAISVRVPLSEALQSANEVSWRLSVALVLLVASVLAVTFYLLQRAFVRPLAALERGVQAAGEGPGLGRQLPLRGLREMRSLTASVNRMSARLAEQRERLVAGEARLRSLFDHAADAVFVHDARGCIRFVNRRACASLGYSYDELTGMRVADVDPDGWTCLAEHLSRLEQGPIEVEGRQHRRDGSTFPVEVRIATVRDEAERLFVAFARDVSERVAAEAERGRLLNILENSPEFVGTADRTGRISYVNSGGRRLLGLSDADIAQRERITDFHPPWAARLIATQAIPEALRTGVWEGESALIDADGREVPVSQLVIAHGDEDGRYLSTIARDIRAQKATQEELRRLAERDFLTGAYTRLKTEAMLEQEIGRARRYRTPLSLIMLDIDHFKRVNDRFGHERGDEVLKAVVACVADQLREADVLGRWGGEEFMVLVPQTALADAAELAERLRRAVAELPMSDPDAVTISAGVVELVHDEDNRSLIGRVDAALYRAKNAGRNRVEAG